MYEPPKVAKECRTQHARPSGSSRNSRVPNFYLIRQETITLKCERQIGGTKKVFHIRFDRKA